MELKELAHFVLSIRPLVAKVDRDKLIDVELPNVLRLFAIRLRLRVVRHEYSDLCCHQRPLAHMTIGHNAETCHRKESGKRSQRRCPASLFEVQQVRLELVTRTK
ncbi:hypothetical protein [Mycobacterium florentinum]|uniref:hypothetical protein n=1 Tax=Mycobacterium florentinum TaxID=292462 RepID=UPI00111C9328|nr:hypothetical protein [Mycobacterium florentinum]MCV7408391.1 hypothetical protein [Mycobacterium florentinum]BBX78115.1 hypothetical protein MFLOJ_19020 [Mycobacterium florentinum]